MILSRRHDTISSSSYCGFSYSPNLVVFNYCASRMLRLSRSPNLVILTYCTVRMLRLSRLLNLLVMILCSANALSFSIAELCCPLIAMPSNGERFYTFKRETWQSNTSQIIQKPLVNRNRSLPRIARGLRPTITMSIPTRARAQIGRKSTGDKSKS